MVRCDATIAGQSGERKIAEACMSDLTAPALQRVLGPVGVTMLTLSVLSSGASVPVAGADILHQAGTGAAAG